MSLELLKHSTASCRRVVARYYKESNTIIQNCGILVKTGVARLEQLDINIRKKQDQLSNSNSNIQELITDEQPLEEKTQEAEGLDNKYGQKVHKVQYLPHRLKKTPTRGSTSDSRSSDVNVKLTKIKFACFLSRIHGREVVHRFVQSSCGRLTKNQKLQHLKSSLTGEADNLLLSQFDGNLITDDNFISSLTFWRFHMTTFN